MCASKAIQALLTCCVSAVLAAVPEPRIIESKSALEFTSGQAVLRLAVESQRTHSSVRVEAEWLDPQDRVLASASSKLPLQTGSSTVALTLPSPALKLPPEKHSDLFWHRIRCRLRGTAARPLTEHILPVSAVPSNLFTLHVLEAEAEEDRSSTRVVVRAVSPVTEKPVAGVAVSAAFDRAIAAAVSGVTDESGLVRLRIGNPPAPSGGEAEEDLVITARAGDFVESVSQRLYLDRGARVHLETDKPLYQPGQTIRIRGIVLRPGGIVPNCPVRVSISSKKRRNLFQATVESSRFGVVAAEWTTPDNAEPGHYAIDAVVEDGIYRGGRGDTTVNLSRYELPSFLVRAKADRPWYLIRDAVTLEISAQYMFGKPLPAGQVVVTDDSNPYWDYKLNKQITPEPVRVEGVLTNGKATIRVEPRSGERLGIESRDYTVTVTEPRGRSEEYRLTVPVGDQPLQLEALDAHRLSTYGRLPFHVRVRYPDGTPARAAVRAVLRCGQAEQPLPEVRTTSHGIAALGPVLLPADAGVCVLAGTAEDEAGRTVIHESLVSPIDSGRRIFVDRWLYRRGDTVRLRIESEHEQETLYIAATVDFRQVDFKLIEIRNHTSAVEFPFREEFQGRVHFNVLRGPSVSEPGEGFVADSISVLFQTGERLSIRMETQRPEYRPGEQVRAELRLTDSAGRPVAGAIGFAVIDKAVQEQARRTEYPDFLDPSSPRVIDSMLLGLDPDDDAAQLLAGAFSGMHGYGARPFVTSGFNVASPYLYSHRIGRDFGQVQDALQSWHAAGNDYPATLSQLLATLKKLRISLGAIRDPWGSAYRLSLKSSAESVRFEVRSAGPDRTFDTIDDVADSVLSWSWFEPSSRVIARALRREKNFPRTEAEFLDVLKRASLSHLLKDPDGKPLKVRMSEEKLGVSNTNVFQFEEYSRNPPTPGAAAIQLVKAPVISLFLEKVWDSGSRQEFAVASFTGPSDDESIRRLMDKPRVRRPHRVPYRSGLRGTVFDPTDAVVPNALIEVSSDESKSVFTTRSDSSGRFTLFLEPGRWTVRTTAMGFVRFVAVNVAIVEGVLTVVNVRLQVGSLSESVEVSAKPGSVQTSVTLMASTRMASQPPPPPGETVRSYFPETLLWLPLLESDAEGRLPVDFELAGSITTWSLRAVASTLDGVIGARSAELRAVQPLFIDYDPPRTLTADDEISLSAAARNYTGAPQRVSVTAEAESGLAIAGASSAQLTIGADESAPVAFPFKASAAGTKAVSRIRLRGADESDAIERAIAIRPDGRLVTAVDNWLVSGGATLTVDVPRSRSPGPITSRLRVYPSVLSHVFESRGALLQRPWGCAEQTISSSFPSLLTLDYLQSEGINNDEATKSRALGYLKTGYDRLAGYQNKDGGMGYFGRGETDAPLTAYAIEFLRGAAKHIDVDAGIIAAAEKWLWSAQRPEGNWRNRYGGGIRDTAFIASVLAAGSADNREQLARAAKWLEENRERNDAYALAGLVRLYAALNNTSAMRAAAESLVALAEGSFWSAVGTTPFSGWGRAGEVETTAFAVSALDAARRAGYAEAARAIDSGIAWLLERKDQDGVWFSTQATMRALQALLATASAGAAARGLSLRVNGRALDPNVFSDLTRPADIDLSGMMSEGENRIELAGTVDRQVLASLRTSWHVPWTEPLPAHNSLSFNVKCDRTSGNVGELFSCEVEAARTSAGAYGMMIAEVGLPPGVVVDEEALREATRRNDSGVWRYEVEPDRVVLYLSSRSTPARATIAFRPRYAMKAKSAPSKLWDYYNPDASAWAAPATFIVRD